MSKTNIVRYSDAELEEFRQIIEKKLASAQEKLESTMAQLLEISENAENEFGTDMVDDSNTVTELEILNDMAIRQRKLIRDMESALVRIRNKTYGICEVTGQLIDKRRLMAMPTATRTVAAASDEPLPAPTRTPPSEDSEREETEPDIEGKQKSVRSATPKVITRVIRKSSTPATPAPKKPAPPKEDDEDFDDLFDEDLSGEEINLPLEGMEDIADDDTDTTDTDEMDDMDDLSGMGDDDEDMEEEDEEVDY